MWFSACILAGSIIAAIGIYRSFSRPRRCRRMTTIRSLNFDKSHEIHTKRIPLDAHDLVDGDDVADAFLLLEEIHQANCQEEPEGGFKQFTRDDVARLVYARDLLTCSHCGQDE